LKGWPLFGKGEAAGLVEGDCMVQRGFIAKWLVGGLAGACVVASSGGERWTG